MKKTAIQILKEEVGDDGMRTLLASENMLMIKVIEAMKKYEKQTGYDLTFITDAGYLEVIESWLYYKKKRKESYKSQKSVELLSKKIYEMSNGNISEAKKMIEHSMACNYAGIVYPKNNQRNETITDKLRQFVTE